MFTLNSSTPTYSFLSVGQFLIYPIIIITTTPTHRFTMPIYTRHLPLILFYLLPVPALSHPVHKHIGHLVFISSLNSVAAVTITHLPSVSPFGRSLGFTLSFASCHKNPQDMHITALYNFSLLFFFFIIFPPFNSWS